MVLQKIVDVNDNSIEVESKSGNVYSVYFNDFPHTDDIPKVERRVDKNKEAFAEISFENGNPEIENLMHYVPRSIEKNREKNIIYNVEEDDVRSIPEESYIRIITEDGEDLGEYFISEQTDSGANVQNVDTREWFYITFFWKGGETKAELYSEPPEQEWVGVIEDIEVVEEGDG